MDKRSASTATIDLVDALRLSTLQGLLTRISHQNGGFSLAL